MNKKTGPGLEQAKAKLEIGDLPACKGDKTQVSQVFSNLIGNAIKYLDPNRPGSIKVSGHQEDNKSIYCVEDNGVGIAPEHQKKVFELFYKLSSDDTLGEGMGLSIVKKIMQGHEGEIWLESELGKGSKFYFSLPKV